MRVLRRFRSAVEVEQLAVVIDEVEEQAWSKLSRQVRRQRTKHELALVDLDGQIKALCALNDKSGPKRPSLFSLTTKSSDEALGTAPLRSAWRSRAATLP